MIKIYCDMDGVLCDFEAAVKSIGAEKGLGKGATEDDKFEMYQEIDKAGTDFWSRMIWLPGATRLWEELLPYTPVILSSPGEFIDAPAGKLEWVNKNVPGTTLYLEIDKWMYAERDAILIDDNLDNIEAWISKGGIGIHHTDTPSTIKKLHKDLERNKLFLVRAIQHIASLLSNQ